MEKPLFVIKDLCCAYRTGHEVLRIPYLEIPKGKLVILLGRSGFGKSTLLETLGLMNNTIKSGDVVFYDETNEKETSYASLWKESNLTEIARIRREHFSFIFQNTNLMPNFTAYENACLTQMISGVSFEAAKEKVKGVMGLMGLSEVPETKRAVELSGGQKQRLAFVRAITPEFLVLFGDEPTGNLDHFNSVELLSILHNNILLNRRSALIVSHNIDLSLKFADILILISKAGKDVSYCKITNEQVFIRPEKTNEPWLTQDGRAVHDMAGRIESLLA